MQPARTAQQVCGSNASYFHSNCKDFLQISYAYTYEICNHRNRQVKMCQLFFYLMLYLKIHTDWAGIDNTPASSSTTSPFNVRYP